MKKEKGTLFLIPVPLADDAAAASYTLYSKQVVNGVKHYLAENEKTARKFLKLAEIQTPQSELVFFDYGKHQRKEQPNFDAFFKLLLTGTDCGLMSEAGCPGVADPGSEIVAKAHALGIKVRPLVGPSSILLLLMASGFNGQQFSFQGYLPIDKNQRVQKIKDLERKIERDNESQIFIETPFRNDSMIEELLKTCKPHLKLCIGCNLSSADEWIQTKSILEWKKEKISFHKMPCIFALYK